MIENDLLILGGNEVDLLLRNKESEIIETIRSAYTIFATEDSALPHSTFLRFPNDAKNRIIGLPGYLGQDFAVAGMKWIASFPNNHDLGLDRASAAIVLNSARTGRPKAFLEGSIISAKRTAASAALGAATLYSNQRMNSVGLIGCGLINLEILKFLLVVFPQLQQVFLYDLFPEQSEKFKNKCEELFENVEIRIEKDCNSVFSQTNLISFATTATVPYVTEASPLFSEKIILHISLRDLKPEVILKCNNVADDIDHVCRAQTSIHLTEQQVGNRNFIKYQLYDFLSGRESVPQLEKKTVIFSPFGLGILDLALSEMVYRAALANDQGMKIHSFLPEYWLNR